MTGTRSVFVFLTHSGPVYINPFTKLSQSFKNSNRNRMFFFFNKCNIIRPCDMTWRGRTRAADVP